MNVVRVWKTSIIISQLTPRLILDSGLMQVKEQKLEPDMELQTGSKLRKEYVKAAYCHPDYLTYIQSTSCEMPGWRTHKLESRLPEEISTTSDM